MPALHVIPHLLKAGGGLAVIGAIIGGMVGHPSCEGLILTGQNCSNALGALGSMTTQDQFNVTAVGVIIGAAIGAAIALVLVVVFHKSKSDLGISE